MKIENKLKGQITTEYLIILAVVLIISLIVVVFFNFFPSINISSASKIKKEFWEESKPISIKEAFYKNSSSRLYLVLNSKIEENMTIKSIFINGKKLAFFYYEPNSSQGVGNALCSPSSCIYYNCDCNIVLKPFEELSVVSEQYADFNNCTNFFETKIEFNYSLENFSALNYSPFFPLIISCTN